MIGLILLGIAFLSLSIDVRPVSAATIVVDTTVDEDTDNTSCSLREAIKAATTNAAYNGCSAGLGGDTITLPAGIYTLTTDSQLPNITSGITINGEGTTSTIIQASTCNPVTESCTHQHLIFNIFTAGTLTLNNLTVRHGNNGYNQCGGAICNYGSLTITNSVFSGNDGSSGGAIRNFLDDANLMVINSTFEGNDATNNGGALFIDGTANIEKSTFVSNNASNGGAIYNYCDDLSLENSTFSANSATSNGGGFYNNGTATLLNNTFSGNSGTGAGIYNHADGYINITNTIIGNSDPGDDNCVLDGTTGTDIAILDDDGTCEDDTVPDLMLGTLANNGGPTKTHALLDGSPAIDSGFWPTCPGTDQRGVIRPQGAGCDIGAYEKEPFVYTYLPLILKQ
jgi:CSLREA domain-containing protein